MSITFECPWCLKRYTLADDLKINERHRCKDCNADLAVVQDASPQTEAVSIKNTVALPVSYPADTPEDVREALKTKPVIVNDKYIIVKKLGQGGMGAVFKAWDTSLKRYVALKMILSSQTESADDNERAERFVHEAQTAAKLVHPNILQVYEVGKYKNDHYICMEYIDGGTLEEYWVKKYHALSMVAGKEKAFYRKLQNRDVKECLELMKQVIGGVEYAHGRGIIHRDIKPENILMRVDEKGGIILKISDFGLAKDIEGNKSLTMAGTVVGTPVYMSPEQAMGEKVDCRSDVFSLGSVLYKLCSGAEPFQGKSVLDVMKAVVNKEPLPPRKLNPAIDGDVETIILKAMEKEMLVRYQSARDLMEDIERFLRDEPILARPASIVYRISKRIKRNRWAYAGTSAVLAVLITAGIWLWSLSAQRYRHALENKKAADKLFEAGDYYKAKDFYVKYMDAVPEDADAIAREKECENKITAEKDKMRREADLAARQNKEMQAKEELRIRAKAVLERSAVATSPDEKIRFGLEALGIDPDYGDAWQAIGYAYKDKKETDNAYQAFSKAVELTPTLAYSYYEKAMITGFNRGDYNESIPDFEQVLKYDPNSHIGYYAKGSIEYGRKNYDEAIADYSMAIEIKSDFAEAYNCRGLAYYQKGETVPAISDCSRAIEINPNYANAYKYRGLAYCKKGEMDLAINDCSMAIELNPNDADTYNYRGSAYLETGKRSKAIKDFNKAIKLKPDFIDAYSNRGNAYTKKGDIDRAIQDYSKAIELNPNYANAYNGRGSAYSKKGETSSALNDFNKAIEIDPDLVYAYNNRGDAYYKEGDIDHAIQDYSKVIELNPNYANAYNDRGIAYSKKGETSSALNDFNKAIEIDPDFIDVYNNRGNVYYQKGDIDHAIQDYSRAIELNPNLMVACKNRGGMYLLKGEIDLAICDYNKVIELNPDDKDTYNGRGDAYFQKGDMDHAIKDYSRVIELSPDFTDAYNNRGLAYSKKGEIDLAISDYNRIIELNPNDGRAYYNRSFAYYRKGEKDKAVSDYNKAIEMNPALRIK